MKRRIGIHASSGVIRVVVVERNVVVATAENTLDSPEGLAPQMDSLFARLGTLVLNASVRIAFEYPLARLKRIGDVPPSRDKRLLERSLVENADRYFIGGSGAYAVAVDCADGATLLAIQKQPLDAITRVAFAAGATEVRASGVRPSGQPRTADLNQEFQGAFDAATEDTFTPVLVLKRRTRNWRPVLIAAGILALVIAAGEPVVRSRRLVARAESARTDLGMRYKDADRARQELHATLALIARAEGGSSRTSPLDLLWQITNEMPPTASLLAFTVDTAKGSAVLLSTSAVEVLPALDSVRSIADVRLSGPVTRERFGDRELERATIVFSWKQAR